MPRCVYDIYCMSEAPVHFKGRMLCIDHARLIRDQLLRIIATIEGRENRVISQEEEIGVNNPRYVQDEFRRVVKLRGQHLTVTKVELASMITG
ncbi:MAG: hypothetical protein ACYC7D_05400 [Nitrososphaerales archaeon]